MRQQCNEPFGELRMNLDELIQQVTRLRQDVDGLIKPEVGRVISWTPTVTQSVSVTCTINNAHYMVLGTIVIVQVRLAITSAGTTNNPIVIGGQPAIMQPVYSGVSHVIGAINILDSGTANYSGSLIAVGATDFRGIADGLGNYIGSTPNFALASGDVISFIAVYQRA